MPIIQHVFYQGGQLPFYVLLIVDGSGSFGSADVPQLYAALDLVRTELVNLGTLTQSQADQIIIQRELGGETLVAWNYTQGLQFQPSGYTDYVIMIFADEALDTYYNQPSDIALYNAHSSDLQQFINKTGVYADETAELIGSRLFAISLSTGSFGIFLDRVYNLAPVAGYNGPPLSSFTNKFGDQTLTVSYPAVSPFVLNQLGVNGIYNLMANYLNEFLPEYGYSLLPIK